MGAGTDTLEAIRTALINAGVATDDGTAAWQCYTGFLPDGQTAQGRALCLYEAAGEPPLEAWKIDYPSFQVVGRGGDQYDYGTLRDKMQDVYYALHAQEANISDQFVFCYAKQSAPLNMGRDELKRPRFAWNFRIMRNRPT